LAEPDLVDLNYKGLHAGIRPDFTLDTKNDFDVSGLAALDRQHLGLKVTESVGRQRRPELRLLARVLRGASRRLRLSRRNRRVERGERRLISSDDRGSPLREGLKLRRARHNGSSVRRGGPGRGLRLRPQGDLGAQQQSD
jgi:hypothetical protein